MSKKGVAGSLLGLGLLILGNVIVIARNSQPEAQLARITEGNSYHFDIAPMRLNRYLPLKNTDAVEKLVLVTDSSEYSLDAEPGWLDLLDRLHLRDNQEVVLVGPGDQTFGALRTRLEARSLRHETFELSNLRSFAGLTGLYPPATVLLGANNQVRIVSTGALDSTEITMLDNVLSGRQSPVEGRPFVSRIKYID